MWGGSVTEAFAVGDFGTILRHDGKAWAPSPVNTTKALYGVWGVPASKAWAVGHGGEIVHYSSSAWSVLSSPTTKPFRAVWGSSATDIHAVGDGGTIRKNGVRSFNPTFIGLKDLTLYFP